MARPPEGAYETEASLPVDERPLQGEALMERGVRYFESVCPSELASARAFSSMGSRKFR